VETQIDRKTLDKIRKLLNLARDGGATEGEASVALEKAREIMAANNLSMAQLEAAGQDGGEGSKRLKTGLTGKALYKYQQRLMHTVADTNFCAVIVDTKATRVGKAYQSRDVGYTLVGREHNVAAALGMFDYLNASLERIVTPHLSSNAQRLSRWAVSFKEGAAQRLSERLRDRHAEMLREQSAAARAQQAAQSTSPVSSGSGAMVVVMEDFAQAEADANYEHRMGLQPGEAAARRARSATTREEWKRREEERRAALTEEERAKEDAAAAKDQAKWDARWQKRSDRYWANRDLDGYWEGRKAADQIGLDTQVTATAPLKAVK
jgi:hypothetical protein